MSRTCQLSRLSFRKWRMQTRPCGNDVVKAVWRRNHCLTRMANDAVPTLTLRLAVQRSLTTMAWCVGPKGGGEVAGVVLLTKLPSRL